LSSAAKEQLAALCCSISGIRAARFRRQNGRRSSSARGKRLEFHDLLRLAIVRADDAAVVHYHICARGFAAEDIREPSIPEAQFRGPLGPQDAERLLDLADRRFRER